MSCQVVIYDVLLSHAMSCMDSNVIQSIKVKSGQIHIKLYTFLMLRNACQVRVSNALPSKPLAVASLIGLLSVCHLVRCVAIDIHIITTLNQV